MSMALERIKHYNIRIKDIIVACYVNLKVFSVKKAQLFNIKIKEECFLV